MHARGVALSVVAAAALVAFGVWVLRPRATGHDATPRGAPEEGPRPGPSLAPMSRDRVRSPSRDEGPAPLDPIRDRSAPTLEPPEFPSLRVEVRLPDGSPPGEGAAYALPAGSPGVDRPSDLARAQCVEGVATLRVPAPGRYDVGVWAGSLRRAFVEDVEIPRSDPLVVTVKPLAPVRVTLAPELATRIRPDAPVAIRLSFAGRERETAFPGRRERPSEIRFELLEAAVTTVDLPEGESFAVGASAVWVDVTPKTFTPPASLEVVPGFAVQHRVVFEPEATAFPYDVDIPVSFDWDGAVTTISFRLRKGSTLGDLGGQWTHLGARAAGRVAWSGPSIVAGSTAYRGSSGRWAHGEDVLPVRVVVRDPPAASKQADRAPVLRVHGVERLPPDSRVELGTDGGHWHVRDAADLRTSPDTRVPLDNPFEWAHAYAVPDWIAGPIRARGRDTDVTLVRGGFLVAVPERMPPEGLSVVIERADEAPLYVEGSPFSSPPDLRPGLVLGPFEPGPIRLRVRIAGTPALEVDATVVAGLHRPLVLPAFAPTTR